MPLDGVGEELAESVLTEDNSRHGARGHCAEGEDGQGPAGGLAWGRRPGRRKAGPAIVAKTKALPNTSEKAEREGGGVLRMPPPEQQPHLEDKSALPLPRELTAVKGTQTPAYPRMQEAGDGAEKLGAAAHSQPVLKQHTI